MSDKLTQDLTDSMILLEEKLRLNQSSSGTDNSGHKGISEEEEMKLLQRCSRPQPMSSNCDRGSSAESIYSNCSNSVVSNCSTVMIPSSSSSGSLSKSERKDFYLDKYISNAERRDEYSLKVINALVSIYKKGAAKDSEGGRLPLHTALVGRATHKVVDTLVKTYPYAVRHRTKDGSLPLHLAAFHGVSHNEVAPILLRHYPYATIGKNRFERTPLEEGLLLGGENGREHQIKLMEALRRPAFYWNNSSHSGINSYSDSKK